MTLRYFAVLAAMRTGSNLLEEALSTMPGIAMHGELFNPHFIAKPKSDNYFGLSLPERDADPIAFIDRVVTRSDGLPGFRLFNDHDPRVLDHVLADPSAAKIILTRRPLDSYVSLKAARKTGQWWLGDQTASRHAKVRFDGSEYARYAEDLAAFYSLIRYRLQTSGQPFFALSYEDISDSDVLRGLARFLGQETAPDLGRVRAKVQNPAPLADRIENASDVVPALARLTDPELAAAPSFEPDRGPGLRAFVAARRPLALYMPLTGPGHDPVPEWLQDLSADGLETGMTQAGLRRWMRQNPAHPSFTIVRHPLARAHDAFCETVLPTGTGRDDIRHALTKRHGLELPPTWPDPGYDLADHRDAFLKFLKFLDGTLSGQSALRLDRLWASQAPQLHAISGIRPPDRIIREDHMSGDLKAMLGTDGPTQWSANWPFTLGEVANDAIRKASSRAYRRDMLVFGFSP